ncbi:alternative ribosome rescue aminoacyl-tRNA hydrolase ArfB [Haliangium sp.]|uniref:alternative ribosome rescue aminoacyl-tRNA hydrolase ArfB n=1 Tax=Haliangium sp. TaxID=2663208 RepID=UPI003D0DF30C
MRDVFVSERLIIPAAELSLSFSRSGGPGGQNVNKVASKVEVRWRPEDSAVLAERDRDLLLRRLGHRLTGAGELIVTSTHTRDQSRNREDALAKLAALIRDALRPPKPRRPTRPSRGARERRLADKRHRATRKQTRRSPDQD